VHTTSNGYEPGYQALLYDLLYMATEKLTVSVQAASIRKLDRWVREGRYANRSQATQAALDMLERRNGLPTLDWALAHPRPLTSAEREAWDSELRAIDAALDTVEPPLPDR
jgi:Arc/MetJ-type ribon-helix-helix transcriptional regulator